MAGIPDSIRHKFRRIIEESNANVRFTQFLINGKDENFKWAYQLAIEYGFGKPSQSIDVDLTDVTNRPSTDTLIQTITALRAELDSLRKGTEMAAGK